MTPTEFFDHLLRKSKSLERSAALLSGLISEEVAFDDDGTLLLVGSRQLLDRINGLTIVVLPREHPPPHFHVVGNGINASFSILDGMHLAGDVTSKQKRAIEFWYPRSRHLLVRTWNETRPTDCPVGPIVES